MNTRITLRHTEGCQCSGCCAQRQLDAFYAREELARETEQREMTVPRPVTK